MANQYEARARKWLLEALKHETAVREMDATQGEESKLHSEAASLLRQYASEILQIVDGASP